MPADPPNDTKATPQYLLSDNGTKEVAHQRRLTSGRKYHEVCIGIDGGGARVVSYLSRWLAPAKNAIIVAPSEPPAIKQMMAVMMVEDMSSPFVFCIACPE